MALPCCTICLDAFDEAKEVSVLDCGHAYHYPCILDWSLQSKGPARCPSCKKTINWYPANGVVSKVFFHQSLDKGKDAALIEELKKQLQEQKDQILKAKHETVVARHHSARSVEAWRKSYLDATASFAKERDQLSKERDQLAGEKNALTKGRDALKKERDALSKERDELSKERDQLKIERDRLAKEQGSRILRRGKLFKVQGNTSAGKVQRLFKVDDLLGSEVIRPVQTVLQTRVQGSDNAIAKEHKGSIEAWCETLEVEEMNRVVTDLPMQQQQRCFVKTRRDRSTPATLPPPASTCFQTESPTLAGTKRSVVASLPEQKNKRMFTRSSSAIDVPKPDVPETPPRLRGRMS